MNQKGLSAIIVTLLVIVITVIIATVFFAWAKDYSKTSNNVATGELQQVSDLSCLNANFKVDSCIIDDDVNAIDVVFLNNSDIKIFNLVLTVQGKNNSDNDSVIIGRFDSAVSGGEVVKLSTDTNFTFTTGTGFDDFNFSTIESMTLTNGTCPKKSFLLNCEIE